MRLTLFSAVLLVLCQVAMPIAHAQEAVQLQPRPITEEEAKAFAEIPYCIAIQPPQVQATISSNLTSAVQSGKVEFTLAVRNSGMTPAADLRAYIRILDGDHLVEVLTVPESFALIPGNERTFTLAWTVPGDLLPGNYHAVPVVLSANRFSLADPAQPLFGLGVMPYEFLVVGEPQGTIRFLAAENGSYAQEVVAKGETREIVKTVRNTSTLSQKVTITHSLYELRPGTKKLVRINSEERTLEGDSTEELAFTVRFPKQEALYELITEIRTPGGSGSFAINRYSSFASEQETRLALIALAVSTYPLENSAAFTCFQGIDEAQGAVKLSVTPTTWLGSLLGAVGLVPSKQYQGLLIGADRILTLPIHNIAWSSFTLRADLFLEGKRMDSASVTYSCKDFGEECPSTIGSTILILVFAIIILAVLGGIPAAFMFWKKKKGDKRRSPKKKS